MTGNQCSRSSTFYTKISRRTIQIQGDFQDFHELQTPYEHNVINSSDDIMPRERSCVMEWLVRLLCLGVCLAWLALAGQVMWTSQLASHKAQTQQRTTHDRRQHLVKAVVECVVAVRGSDHDRQQYHVSHVSHTTCTNAPCCRTPRPVLLRKFAKILSWTITF